MNGSEEGGRAAGGGCTTLPPGDRQRVCLAEPLKKDWVLTQEAFDLLLGLLAPEREAAGQRYEELRASLVRFFEWRGGAHPEEYADESLNRAARRLAGGAPVADVSGYCFGVARMVLMEALRRQEHERRALADLSTPRDNAEERAEAERRSASLNECLGRLAADERELIVQYYLGERAAKIENRRRLAVRFGLAHGTLRMRALRLREALEACVSERLNRGRATL